MRRHGLAVLISLLAVVLLTWPLLPQAGLLLPNAARDGQENTWNIWWMREALLVRHVSPFWASSLYYPTGTSLYFHALGLAAAPIAIPLQAVVAPPTALVLTLLLLIWITVLSTYALLWDLVRYRPAALLGGIVVGLAPAHLYHLLMGQINLTAFCAVPLILLAQRRVMRRQWLWVVGGGAAVAWCGLADWQYLLQALLLAGGLLLSALWRRRARPRAALATGAWGAAPVLLGMLLLAPLITAMIGELRMSVSEAGVSYAARPLQQAELRSADLLSLVIPNPYHPLWGDAGRAWYSHAYPTVPYAGGVGSLGLIALVVGALAVWRWRPPARTWLILLVIGAVLALGPDLHLNGADLDVPLPYRLLRLVPYLDISRVPAVFLKWVLLALAVLVAFGVRVLVARTGRAWRGRAILIGVAAAIVVEGLAAPLTVPVRPAVSACYEVLAADPTPGAVLDLPEIDANEPMYYQTIHGRPVAGGDLSRDNPYPFLFSTPVVTQLVRGQRIWPAEIFPLATGAPARAMLAGWGIRWIVLRPGDAGPSLPRFEAALARVVGDTPPLCSDAHARLWRLDAPTTPQVLAVESGWHDPEQSGQGAVYRWLAAEGTVEVAMPVAGRARLALDATAHLIPRTLEIWLGDMRQAQLSILTGSAVPLSTVVDLPAGRSTLRLRAVEPPAPGSVSDARLLTVAIASLRLEPISASNVTSAP